jgi:hypothetical protein
VDDLQSQHWTRYTAGAGVIEAKNGTLRFLTQGAVAGRLTDAQIDDYQGVARRHLPWRPPLRLTVRARASHPVGELVGTAGFGFWNAPFGVGTSLPALPRAVWFFYASPPSDMALAAGVPGRGWKATVIDAGRWQAKLLLPGAPLGFLLMRLPALYRRLWPLAQRAIGVSERLLDVDWTAWHSYGLAWRRDGASFWVDGVEVLRTPLAPGGPLGFVAWLDNQFAVVRPLGVFRFGLLAVPHYQWLEIGDLSITVMKGTSDG